MCLPLQEEATCSWSLSTAEGKSANWECQLSAAPSSNFSLLLNETVIPPSQPGMRCGRESQVVFLVQEEDQHICYSRFKFTTLICSTNEGVVWNFGIISSSGGVVSGTSITVTLGDEQGTLSTAQDI